MCHQQEFSLELNCFIILIIICLFHQANHLGCDNRNKEWMKIFHSVLCTGLCGFLLSWPAGGVQASGHHHSGEFGAHLMGLVPLLHHTWDFYCSDSTCCSQPILPEGQWNKCTNMNVATDVCIFTAEAFLKICCSTQSLFVLFLALSVVVTQLPPCGLQCVQQFYLSKPSVGIFNWLLNAS